MGPRHCAYQTRLQLGTDRRCAIRWSVAPCHVLPHRSETDNYRAHEDRQARISQRCNLPVRKVATGQTRLPFGPPASRVNSPIVIIGRVKRVRALAFARMSAQIISDSSEACQCFPGDSLTYCKILIALPKRSCMKRLTIERRLRM